MLPNQASVTFSVENSEYKADTATKRNSEITNKVINALKRISNKDVVISTANYTIHPLYERDKDFYEKSNRVAPKGYRVNNSIFVTTTRINSLGMIIDTAVGAGATRVGTLTFFRNDKEQIQKQAATKALENAVDYAKRLAKAAGFGVNKVKYIQYVPSNTEPLGKEIVQAEEMSPTPIIPGHITFESYVNVTFELIQ